MDRRLSGLLSGTLVYGLGGVLQRAVSIVLLPVLTRYLVPAEYGVIAVLDVLATSLVAILSLGFGTSMTVTYFADGSPTRRERTVSTAFWLLSGATGLTLALALPAAGRIASFLVDDAAAARLVALSLVTSALSVLALPFTLRLQFEQRATRQTALSFIAAVLTACLSLLFVVVLGRGVAGLLEGRLLAQGAGFLLYLSTFPPRRLAGAGAIDRATAGELLRLGLPMVPSFATLFVLQQGNRWFLSLFESLDAVGVYSLGTQLGSVVAIGVAAFSTAFTPYFMAFSEHRHEAPATLSRTATWYVFGFGTIAFLVFGGARAATMLLAAPPYEPGFRVAGAAAVAQAAIGAYSLFTPPAVFAKEIHYTSVVQAATLVVAVALNFFFIPAWGMMGAALALVLGALARVLFLVLWNRSRGSRYVHIPLDGRRIAALLAAYLPVTVLLTWPRTWSLAAEFGVLLLACCWAAAVLLFLTTAAEREALARLLPGWRTA